MAVTWQEFLSKQEQYDYPASPEQLAALKTLFSDPVTPVSEVAKQITKPIIAELDRAAKNPDAESEYEYSIIWRTICDAVKQLPEFNDKLVELVVEIQKTPNEYIAFMQDLQMHLNEFAFEFKDPRFSDPEIVDKRQSWVNINAFCAKISTKGVPRLDQRQRAAWVMRHTLEETPWLEFSFPDIDELIQDLEEDPEDEVIRESIEEELETKDVRTLNSWVPAAAVWYKIVGKGLYELEEPMTDEYDYVVTNWKGKKGWSKERFAFWRERFEWISKVTALDKETKIAAKETAELMKSVEDGK